MFVPANGPARSCRFGPSEWLPADDEEPLSFSENSKIMPVLDAPRLIVFPSVRDAGADIFVWPLGTNVSSYVRIVYLRHNDYNKCIEMSFYFLTGRIWDIFSPLCNLSVMFIKAAMSVPKA